MKQMMVANFQEKSRYSLEKLNKNICAQLENSLQIGWKPEDILLVTNFEFSFKGIKPVRFDLNESCLTGSKIFALKALFDNGMINEETWAHDLDCWQTVSFDFPEFKDIGIATYSSSKFNGGSVFVRPESHDIINKIAEEITKNNEPREEPTINRILKSEEYEPRTTVVSNSYNVGCSGLVVRYERAIKDCGITRCVHMHPENRIAFDSMFRDRNRLGKIVATRRLYDLFMKFFGEKIKTFKYVGERGYDGDYRPPTHIPFSDELEGYSKNDVIYCVNGKGLGDCWASVNYLLRKSEIIGEPVKLCTWFHGGHGMIRDVKQKLEEIIPLLNSKGTIILTEKKGDQYLNADQVYQDPYFKTHMEWTENKRSYFSYQFDGFSHKKFSNMSKEEEEKILKHITNKGYVVRKLGKNQTIRECVRILAESKFFVGVDSGMMHLAHSVGTPVYAILNKRNKQTFEEIHYKKKYTLCLDADEFTKTFPDGSNGI